MITNYWYDQQIRRYMLQFCAIFVGLKVKTGEGECSTDESGNFVQSAPEYITVPIRLGSKDRVVAAIEAGNTQNKPFSLPAIAVNETNIALNPDARKGVGFVDNRTVLPSSGVFPTDLKVATRVMPIPYTLDVEVAIYTSNKDQMQQVLEQILSIFDPTIQIQTTDAAFDWTKITTVELTNISNEENYPPGGDRRILVWSLQFSMPIYLSMPLDIRNNLVRQVQVILADLDNLRRNIQELGPNGELSDLLEGDEIYNRYGAIEVSEDDED